MKLVYAWDKHKPWPSREITSVVDRVKIGKAVFTALGPDAVDLVQRGGSEVFLDLKYHDIPNTVSEAVKAACDLGVSMLNVHASGGMEMMEAAAKAAESYDTEVIAVTLLTSVKLLDLHAIGLPLDPKKGQNGMNDKFAVVVMSLAARNAGLDGVVCSAQEAAAVRESWLDATIVCPGIRPTWAVANDQKRPTTPTDALLSGASEVVLGRAISEPPEAIVVEDWIGPSVRKVLIDLEALQVHELNQSSRYSVPGTTQNALALIRAEIEDAEGS